MRAHLILTLFAIVISQTVNLAFGQIVYDAILLGGLPGGTFTTPYSISDNGQIVGGGFPDEGQYAAIKFVPGRGNHGIRLSNSYSCARAVNDGEQIVGYGYEGTSNMKPLLFDPTGNGNNVILAAFSGEYGGSAYAINNSGQIVGASGNGEDSRAWLFDITGNGNNLCLGQGFAVSISDNGLIVGSSYPIHGDGWHATLFDSTGGGNNIDLGTLFPTDDRSFANAINDNGQIVGTSGGPDSGYTAALYDPTGNGNNIALGTIGDSYAECINNSGQIVGSENGHATLFDPTDAGNNIDLNVFIDHGSGWTLEYAYCINDNGWIVARGFNWAGDIQAFLLVPEPATLLLFTLSLLPLLHRRREV